MLVSVGIGIGGCAGLQHRSLSLLVGWVLLALMLVAVLLVVLVGFFPESV